MENMKAKVSEIFEKIQNDGDYANKFKSNPVGAVEEIIGVDLPDYQINEIVNLVKAKITISNSSALGRFSNLI